MNQVARAEEEEPWWKDWRWPTAAAAFFMSVGFCAFVAITLSTNQTVADQAPVIDRLEELAEANRQTLVKVENNQTGIDSLVAFVEEIRARESQSGGDGDAVSRIIEILCASSDPVRIEACQRLQGEGDPP